MGRYNLKGFVSALTIVIAHMLKWDHQPRRRTAGWQRSIEEHRARVRRGLVVRPMTETRLDDMVGRAYQPARTLAAKETKLPHSTFSETCPYAWTEIMSREHEMTEPRDKASG